MLKYHLFIQGYLTLSQKRQKLKKQSAFLQLVKGASVDVDGCASVKYEVGREKQEYKFFILTEMNRNIILDRD